ncbi:type II toxin-antitoxin system HicA family toxin [Candidatus Protochlamydia phocaeensis]|uniref:type II toxin-antitoxin system HicA family toxin n=1 Tax=Candidatus Protochlamydia phocaeensis TaxID=1414722 RepID=UPI0008395724|nr:type II toxin-antitoxin system HicA family toxin [Candidatus Protochlamydia phocaeensis]
MKKRDLEKKLSQQGWWLDRHGGNHDIWTNGEIYEPVPRHPEINELLAKKILKKAVNNPAKEKE